MELVVFPDVEDALRVALTTALPGLGFAGVRAYTSRPPQFPDVFTVITRVGGGKRDMVTDAPLVAFDMYARKSGAPWEGGAVALAGTVSAWADALERGGHSAELTVYESETTTGPYRNPDPLAQTHARFTINVALAVRGRSITV